jgi:ISXO2-like transposase domain
LSLLDGETKQGRAVIVDDLKPATVVPILEENISKEARVMTDEAGHYYYLRDSFAEHKVVRHGQEEYVSLGDRLISSQPDAG